MKKNNKLECNISYENYFKEHYKSDFSKKDLEDYEKWLSTQWSFIKHEISYASNNQKTRILEIGSGFGGFYNILQREGFVGEYVGIELDSDAAAFSNDFFRTQAFKNLSLSDYNCPNRFDLVVAFEVLEHLENPSKSLREIANLLQPTGIFFGTTPFPYKKNVLADKTHLSVLHPENWRRLFTMSGFKSIKLYPMSFFPLLWRVHPGLNIRLPFFVPFSHFISTCLIVAEK